MRGGRENKRSDGVVTGIPVLKSEYISPLNLESNPKKLFIWKAFQSYVRRSGAVVAPASAGNIGSAPEYISGFK